MTTWDCAAVVTSVSDALSVLTGFSLVVLKGQVGSPSDVVV